jgi:hypothetical protein
MLPVPAGTGRAGRSGPPVYHGLAGCEPTTSAAAAGP